MSHKKQQIMLFLNRRGYAGTVSCRACGEGMKCPHCDVSMAEHVGGKMECHYCGYKTEYLGIPNLRSRLRFNYIQADIDIEETANIELKPFTLCPFKL